MVCLIPTTIGGLLSAIGIKTIMCTGDNPLTAAAIANDVAKYFAIIPAMFMASIPQLDVLNVMHLHRIQCDPVGSDFTVTFEQQLYDSMERVMFRHRVWGFCMMFIGVPILTLAAVCTCTVVVVLPMALVCGWI